MQRMFVRHKVRGGVYEHLGPGRLQTEVPLRDMDRVEVYRDVKDGRLWARRAQEFVDGRYEETSLPAQLVPDGIGSWHYTVAIGLWVLIASLLLDAYAQWYS